MRPVGRNEARGEALARELARSAAGRGGVSRLPAGRMAGDWATIVRELRAQESGHRGAADLVLRPGGVVDRVPLGSSVIEGDVVSTLPPERMAAMAGPSVADVAEISRLDPENLENWTPERRGEFCGWTFELMPPFRSQGWFKFLVFRNPSDGNRLRTAPLYPNRDHLFGHVPHMITARVGGYEIPVICGPAGRAAVDFRQARGDAAKWMIYTSYQLAGLAAPFSE